MIMTGEFEEEGKARANLGHKLIRLLQGMCVSGTVRPDFFLGGQPE